VRHGPCADESCGHARCGQKRQVAAAVCAYCKKPVGYSRHWQPSMFRGFVHQSCQNAYEGQDAVQNQKRLADAHIN
jgi:hypothetical protein